MAQFYFHLWRGGHLTPNEAGVALPSLKAAQERAEQMASSILDRDEGAPTNLPGWDIEVIDAAGRTVLVVPVGDGSLETKWSRAA
jgi:hypothetical protein